MSLRTAPRTDVRIRIITTLLILPIEYLLSRIAPIPFVLATASVVVLLALIASLRKAEVSLLAAEVILFGLLLRSPAHPSTALVACSLLGIGAFLLPFVLWPLGRSRMFPLPHIFGLMSACYLYVGVTFARPSDSLIPLINDNQRTRGAILSAIFAFSICLGVYLVRPPAGAAPVGPKAAFHSERIVERSLLLTAGSLMISTFITYAQLRARLGAIAQLIDIVRLVGLMGIFVSCLSGEVNRRWTSFVALAALLAGISGAGTARLYASALIPLGALVLVVAFRRKVPWLVVVMVLLASVVLNAEKDHYRNSYASASGGSSLSAGLRFVHFITVDSQLSVHSLSRSGARFSYSATDLMGYIDSKLPSQFPTWGSTTYEVLPLTVVPRALVPFKRQLFFGNAFGHRYGLLQPGDMQTSENFPLAVEALVAYGYAGLLLIGLSTGVVFGWIAKRFCRDTFEDMLIGTAVTTTVLNGVESNSIIAMGPIPLLLLAIPTVVRWAVSVRSRAGS